MKFKSYYVVWKQKRLSIHSQTRGAFKSYYVVWKLARASAIASPL